MTTETQKTCCNCKKETEDREYIYTDARWVYDFRRNKFLCIDCLKSYSDKQEEFEKLLKRAFGITSVLDEVEDDRKTRQKGGD